MYTSTTLDVRAGTDARLLTVGVEEEFLLLDPATGDVAPVAPQVLALLGGEPSIKHEAMRYQLETNTGVCTTLEEIRSDITRLRGLASDAAAQLGFRLVASGVVPRHLPGLPALTETPRYQALAQRFARLVAGCGTCGCHVHIGIPSRELGVNVLGRLRPWLATLLAISANSPIADGRDTSWASWRYHRWSRWPSAVPPRVWRGVSDYDATILDLIRHGRALDERGVYFHARLSPRYPTVEVRIMDACLTAEDTVLVAALVRALVAAALDEARRGVPIEPLRDSRIASALSAAARGGLQGMGIDPRTGRAVDQRLLTDLLLDHVLDDGLIADMLDRLNERGTGAERQRAMWSQTATPQEFTQFLADATVCTQMEPIAARPPVPAVVPT
ncbi:glutamate--cysteine ligase [Streptosporangium sp. NPDC000396]|uniref:carboxylate-amine ligase n=1 Tax=Streptosporangium sp. NPDC000396 TaxID=3366185 RepID=UPI0036CD2309